MSFISLLKSLLPSPADYPYVDGIPLLVVEVLSPSDKIEEINIHRRPGHAGVTIRAQ
jgi:Uma2 family endonuclease